MLIAVHPDQLHAACPGIRSGLAMVYRNQAGEQSNNGHVVTLVHASDGYDFLVDASHPEPLACHRGLMVNGQDGLCYVRPTYNQHRTILGYRSAAGAVLTRVEPLDTRFALSQVNFYRGERNPGGLMEGKASPEGLRLSANYFETSLRLDPQNPLPVYSLGRVYEKLGQGRLAYRYFLRAQRLYRHHGWVPDSVSKAVQRTLADLS